MDWHIPPIGRKSCRSGDAFDKDERVVSLLTRTGDGIARWDLREAEEAGYEPEGQSICRWVQTFKPKDDSKKEALESMKLTAENLFIGLFDSEEGPSQENAELKRLLGLMLERRRLLRAKEKNDRFILYAHRPSKSEYAVPNVDLSPEFFLENQEKLSFLSVSEEPSDKSHGISKTPESGST